MPVTTTRRNAGNSFHTTLNTSLSSGTVTSGIVLNAIIRNGAVVSPPTDIVTNGCVLRFYRGSLEEHLSCTSLTVDATTKNITLVGVTRDLPFNDGTSYVTAGGGQPWSAGTFVDLVLDARHMNAAAFQDLSNTFTADQSITGSLTVSGNGNAVKVPTMATGSAPAEVDGKVFYDSTQNLWQFGQGGSYVGLGSAAATPDATTSVKGKSKLAAAADTIAGTAGAVTIPASLAVTSSSGAVNGSVPALNSAVALDRTIGGLGTVSGTAYTLLANGTTSTAATQSLASVGTSGQVLTSNGASALPTFQATSSNLSTRAFTVADSAAFGASSTSEIDCPVGYQYTIPINDWAAGVEYLVQYDGYNEILTSGNLIVRVYIGSTAIASITQTTATTNRSCTFDLRLVCQTTGVSGTVNVLGYTYNLDGTVYARIGRSGSAAAITVDTTATQLIKMTAQFSASNSQHKQHVTQFNVYKVGISS